MPTLTKPLDFPYDVDGLKLKDVSEWNETSHELQLQGQREQDHTQVQQREVQLPQRDHMQQRELQWPQRESAQQFQQRDWNQLPQDKAQQRQRDRNCMQTHQFQSINNLLLDQSLSNVQGYSSQDVSCTLSNNSNKTNGDMSISDLFRLDLPRGALINKQSTIGFPGYRNYHHHGQNRNQGTSQHYQYEERNGICSNSLQLDVPSSPSSITTPGSPSTPGSLYSNPYTYSSASNSNRTTSPQTRKPMQYVDSPPSPIHSPYYGRPIRSSPPYSDCNSPTLEYPYALGCSGTRSNSPADSEISGISSMHGSLPDLMNCLSLNSSLQGCYSQSLGSMMSTNMDLCTNNRTTAFQRMAAKKYLSSSQQNSSPLHHDHNHHCNQNQNSNFSNTFLNHEKNCYRTGNGHVMPLNSPLTNILDFQISLDRVARFHRSAAALSDPTCTWSGLLPQRTEKLSGYSTKVFLGGVPWDITESLLIATFKQFGHIQVEWPGKNQSATQPKGYVYIIFQSEKQVKTLLDSCTHDFTNDGSWYFKISSKRMKAKEVQVIPWVLSDSNYVKFSSQKLDPRKTVFVGALHGMLTASDLATIMDDLFGGVIYAGIDTDKYKYPIGSGRVTFSTKHSFSKAVAAAFIEIKTAKFTKKVQVDPYLEDSMCSSCFVHQGPYFCREAVCSQYFCRSCWQRHHVLESRWHHKPLMRDSKTNQAIGLTPNINYGSRIMNNPTI